MNAAKEGNKVSVHDKVHPMVYLVMLGLVMGFGLAILGITVSGLAGLAFTVAGIVLSLATILLPAAWRAWNRGGAAERPSFAEWLAGAFVTWQARLKGGEALVQMLLPIAAASFGMLALALVLHFDVGA